MPVEGPASFSRRPGSPWGNNRRRLSRGGLEADEGLSRISKLRISVEFRPPEIPWKVRIRHSIWHRTNSISARAVGTASRRQISALLYLNSSFDETHSIAAVASHRIGSTGAATVARTDYRARADYRLSPSLRRGREHCDPRPPVFVLHSRRKVHAYRFGGAIPRRSNHRVVDWEGLEPSARRKLQRTHWSIARTVRHATGHRRIQGTGTMSLESNR